MLHLFLNLYTKHVLFILLHIGNIKAYVIVSFHHFQLSELYLNSGLCLVCRMCVLVDCLFENGHFLSVATLKIQASCNECAYTHCVIALSAGFYVRTVEALDEKMLGGR